MNRWLRILLTIIKARFRNRIKPDEKTSLNLRVWITDVDVAVMNNAAMMSVMELGRVDLMVRTGFLKYARANKLFLPLASLAVQFKQPLKRFQKFKLTTQLVYWDEKWIYLIDRIIRKEKMIAIALAKIAIMKRRERVPFASVINDLNWKLKPKKRPKLIDEFEKRDALFLENYVAILQDEQNEVSAR